MEVAALRPHRSTYTYRLVNATIIFGERLSSEMASDKYLLPQIITQQLLYWSVGASSDFFFPVVFFFVTDSAGGGADLSLLLSSRVV
jgi:hypothetical protein